MQNNLIALVETPFTVIGKGRIRCQNTDFDMKVARIKRNLYFCSTEIDREVCADIKCDWQGEPVKWICNIRICQCPDCIKRRSALAYDTIKPHFDNINNLVVFTLTFAYEKIDFMDNDFVSKCFSCVDNWIKKLHDQFHFIRFVVNTDIVKKPNGKFHIHYNVAADCLDQNLFDCLKDRSNFSCFQLWCRKEWRLSSAIMAEGSYHMSVEPKRYKQQIQKALNYFILRTAEPNKKEKKHPFIPIAVEEYVKFFYKKHFIRYRYSNCNEGCKLVKNSNIDIPSAKMLGKCPKCGSVTTTLNRKFGCSFNTPPPIEDFLFDKSNFGLSLVNQKFIDDFELKQNVEAC